MYAPSLNIAPIQRQLHMESFIPSICITPARIRAGCACSTTIVIVMRPTLMCRMQMLPLRLGIATRWVGSERRHG